MSWKGISGQHWERISYIALEVHDLGGRVDRAASLLKQNGYALEVTQERHLWAARRRVGVRFEPAAETTRISPLETRRNRPCSLVAGRRERGDERQ